MPHRWAQSHLELAYAGTVDSSQGVTVDRAGVYSGTTLGISGVYSGTTRGRQAPLYVAEARTPEQAQSVVARAIRAHHGGTLAPDAPAKAGPTWAKAPCKNNIYDWSCGRIT